MKRWNFGLVVKAAVMAAVLGLAGNMFGQGCPNGATPATPNAPTGNLSSGSNATFQWTAASPVPTGYDVFVSYNGSANTTVACSAGPTTTNCTAANLPDGHYEYLVRAHYTGCTPGIDSTRRDFTIGCPTTAPQLTFPADNATGVGTTVTLRWTDVGAPAYDIYLGPVGSICSSNAPQATSTTTSFTPPTLAFGTTYEWKVVPRKPNCGLISSSCFHFTTCAPPGSFDLALPPNGSQGTTTPTFSWNAAPGASFYKFHIGLANPPASQANDPSVTTTSYTPGGLSAATYFWYVDAYTSCGAKISSTSVFSFTLRSACPNNGPSLQGPPNNAALDDTKPVSFSWTSVGGAVGYDLLVSKDNGANFQVSASTSGESSTSVSLTVPDGSYLWFVRALFGAGCSPAPSSIQRFSVVAPQNCGANAAPALLTPANGATNVTAPITFTWNASANAVAYKVFLISGSTTNNSPTLLGTTTSPKLTSSVPSGTWAWYVEAEFDGCDGKASGRYTFSTADTAGCPTTAPSLVAPTNNSAGNSGPGQMTFSWGAVPSAVAYRLFISINGGSATQAAVTTDTTRTISLPDGPLQWWVDAVFENCPATESAHFNFTMQSPPDCPSNPGTPTLTAPANGAVDLNSPVTLSWTAVSGATGYKVYGSLGTSAPVQVAETNATQVTLPLPQGTITWFVQALFGRDCSSTVSTKSTFTVKTGASCANTTAATLVSPNNGATNVGQPVQFAWNAVPGAVAYELFVSANGGTPDLAGVTTDTHIDRLVPEGTILWTVVTQFVGCPEQKSATFQFTTKGAGNCPTGSLSLISPAEGSSSGSPVNFQWSSLNGATSYRLYVSVNGSAPAVLARVSSTSATVSLPSGSIEWAVEALGAQATCASIFSPRGHFTIAQAANCSTHKPVVLTAPAAGSSVASPVTFTWNATDGATAYRVWISEDGEPFDDIGLTKDTKLVHDVDPGRIRWFVEAFFDACPQVASAISEFTVPGSDECHNEVPSTLTPGDDDVAVSSPVTFTWSDLENAEQYRVFASLNGGDFVLIGTTDDPELTRSLPPGKFTWFVEATFESCSATRSEKSSFTIPASANCNGQAPQLVSPNDGATDVTSPVDLIWNPVSGAVGYIVIARLGDGAPTPIGETQDTHLMRALPPGKFQWWVIAFFNGCSAAESKHQTFTIADDAQCDHKHPILLSPPEGTNGLAQQVILEWTPVAGATGYKVFAAVDREGPSVIANTTLPFAKVTLPPGQIHWSVEAIFANCPPLASAVGEFTVATTQPPCSQPDKPRISVIGQVASGSSYNVRWIPIPNASVYELQESTTTDFLNATTQVVSGISASFTHDATTSPTPYFYRVRAVSNCSDARGPYSNVVGVIVLPPKPAGGNSTTAEVGAQGHVVQIIKLPGSSTPVSFSAHADKPWLTVTPSSGVIPPEGITLTVTSDPSVLALGTNTGTVILSYSGAGKTAGNLDTPTTVPVSISLVTPVTPGGKSTPTPDTLIIPAVAHAAGANNSLFESDVRITNLGAQSMKYTLTFTPSQTDGTQSGKFTTIEVQPGATTALDDILSSFFGLGTDGSSASGVLQIQPLSATTSTLGTTAASTQTVASSRTYNFTPSGTFGQYIPAIPFSQFISKPPDPSVKTLLSLQQIAQSAAYRTNFGLVEAAGEPATVVASVYNNANVKLASIPISLLPGEHLQLNGFLAANNVALEDGRIEVEVTSATGRVTAYASVVDNRTNDPLLISPVVKGGLTASRFTIPGVADINNGIASWRTDIRLFNAGTASTNATLNYYPQGAPGSPLTTTVTLAPGEVKAIDNTLQTLFNLTNSGGSVTVTTPSAANVVATARTYNQTSNGTYGQFIPAVTPDESVGLDDRSLQLLQLEQSTRFRTNVGMAETTGSAATVEISVILPDSKVIPKVQIPLAANEFRQISLADFGLSNAYNARATVRVVSGSGKVTAYGSVIDQLTQDPTYVPAQ